MNFIECNYDKALIPTIFDWEELKNHILASFVSKDIKEEYRRVLESVKQNPSENLPAFVRRFKHKVSKAYGVGPYGAEVDRIIMKHFVKALFNPQIVGRMYGSTQAPETFDEAVAMAEKIQMTLDKAQSVGINIQMQQVEFGAFGEQPKTNSTIKSDSKGLDKVLEQLTTKLAKLDSKVDSKFDQLNKKQSEFGNLVKNIQKERDTVLPPNNTVGQYTNNRRYQRGGGRGGYRNVNGNRREYQWVNGEPVCHFCSAVGHTYRRCEKRISQGGASAPSTQGPSNNNNGPQGN